MRSRERPFCRAILLRYQAQPPPPQTSGQRCKETPHHCRIQPGNYPPLHLSYLRRHPNRILVHHNTTTITVREGTITAMLMDTITVTAWDTITATAWDTITVMHTILTDMERQDMKARL